MLFGEPITLQMVATGGIVLAVLVVFQLLTGKRIVRFKGRLHWRVHAWSAYLMAVVLVYHGALGLAIVYQWSLF